MKVLLVGNSEADKQFSMLGFVGALRRGLEARGVTVRVVAPQARLAHSVAGRRQPRIQKWLGYLDKYLLFPPILQQEISRFRPHVVHICDQGNALYIPRIRAYPHVITCHDLLAIRSALGEIPENRVGRSGRLYQRLILRGLSQARHIVCVSDATRADAERLVRTPPECRTEVLTPGLFSDLGPLPEADRLSFLKELRVDSARPFLLHVGSNQFYKNRLGVLRTYAALRKHLSKSTGSTSIPDLVMVGKEFTGEMKHLVKTDSNLRGYVHSLSAVSDEGLRALYSHALALLFPSLYEGFGMPVIEAQACGCPVFTSNRAPLTEIAGSAAGYIDPEQPDEAACYIANRLSKSADRERMIEAGYENVRLRFANERMISDYIALYEKLRTTTCSATTIAAAQTAKGQV